MKAKDYIKALHMEPLVDEGGWFAPIWRSEDDKTVSAIYYLLKAGEISRWHQLRRSNEIWTWRAGGVMEMTLGGSKDWPCDKARRASQLIGSDEPMAVVPAGTWQTTRVREGDFVLVSCVVAPAFQEDDCYLPHPSVEEVEGHV